MKHATHESTLDNGIKLLVIDVSDSNHFNLVIAMNSGYRQATLEDIEQYEVPHLLEHMVFDGSASYPSQEALNDIFSISGGSYNGTTTPYHNMFMFNNKVKNATTILPAALDMVFHPLLKEESFNEEIRVVENELSEYMGDFALNADQHTQQQIIPSLPVSTDTQLTRLQAVTYQATASYHKKYYGTANTTIIVSCDTKKLSHRKIETLIVKATNAAPKLLRYELPTFNFVEKTDHLTQFIEIGKSIDQSIASIQYVVSGKASDKLLQALSLFASIASGMNSNSVNYKLRKMGLVYGMSLELSASIESYGIELSVQSDNDKFFDIFSYTIGLTRDLIENGIPETVFQKLKSEYIEQFDDAVSTSDGIMSWYLGDYLMTESLLRPDDYKKIVSAVSQKGMLAAAGKLVSYDNQFATVFSAKGIRVASGMDTLSKSILADNEIVDAVLITNSTLPLNVKRLLGKELNGYYEYDQNAGPLKKVAYYINSRPLLAWTGITVEFLFGIVLIYAFSASLFTDNLFFKIIGIVAGVACIVESAADVYIRLKLKKQ
jgi:predicted Zn-dependent peptidase